MAKLNLSPEAQEARRIFSRKYYQEHKEVIDARNAEWKKQHPEQVQKYRQNTWERKAEALGLKKTKEEQRGEKQ